MNDRDWKRATDELMQRWPVWKPSEADITDFKRALEGLDRETVAEACFRARAKYSGDVPKLKWMLEAIKEIKAEQREQFYLAALTERNQVDVGLEEWAQDQASVIRFLTSVEADRRDSAFDTVVARPFMKSLVGPDVKRTDIQTWGYTLRSFVWAVLTQDSVPYHHIRGTASCSQEQSMY